MNFEQLFFTSHFQHLIRSAAAANLSAASIDIGISQAALSNSIKKVEDIVGYRIFERAKGKTKNKLTPQGEKLIEALREIERAFNAAMAKSDTRLIEPLVIGASMHLAIRYLFPVLRADEIKSQVYALRVKYLIDGLSAGKIDFGLLSCYEEPKSLNVKYLGADYFRLVGLKSKFPEVAKAKSEKELVHLPRLSEVQPYQLNFFDILRPHETGFMMDDHHVGTALINQGLIAEDYFLDHFSDQELRELAIAKFKPKLPSKIFFAWRKGLPDDKFVQIKSLMQLLEKQIAIRHSLYEKLKI